MARSTKKTNSSAFICESESGTLLSSKLEQEAWDANQTLVEFLGSEKFPSVEDTLFSWKKSGSSHLANAKETYSWREVIDSIKAADLEELSMAIEGIGEKPPALLKSKPIMLRVAGEITNSLLHSYNNRHKIKFVQYDST